MTRRASVAAPSEPVSITIPDWTPTLDLSPNRPTHWQKKRRHRDAARLLARGVIRSWRNDHGHFGEDVLLTGKATIQIVVRWEKGRKLMDGDNIAACMKSTVDALEQEKIIGNDRDLTWLPVIQERDREGRGSVTMTLTAIQEGERAA